MIGKDMARIIFDSSALLAWLNKERKWEVIQDYIADIGISAVNLSEVYKDLLVDGNFTVEKAQQVIARLGVCIYPFDQTQALLTADIYKDVKQFGLSTGDRACFACAIVHRLPVITCDRAWAKVDLGVEVILVDRTVLTEA
jgi:PIN domain nuclease of toxin-antitoxin system